MDEREKLQERYDDAAFALMMDECAEADGEAFLAEFRAAAEAGDLPEIPADLDRRFRDTIRREFAARERKVRFRQFKRAAARVAVAVFAVIGILSTLVMTVDAIRIPVMNFFIEYYDGFAEIFTQEKKEEYVGEDVYDLLEDLLPEEYAQFMDNEDEWIRQAAYKNADADMVTLIVTPPGTEKKVDTEGAICSEILLSDHKALLVEKNGYTVIWTDDLGAQYCFRATGLTKQQVMEICATLAMLGQ